jgi:hypothetical protein
VAKDSTSRSIATSLLGAVIIGKRGAVIVPAKLRKRFDCFWMPRCCSPQPIDPMLTRLSKTIEFVDALSNDIPQGILLSDIHGDATRTGTDGMFVSTKHLSLM